MKGSSLLAGRTGPSGLAERMSGVRGNYLGNRAWTRAKAVAEGCAESIATLSRRMETVTRAPILRSLSRRVPAVGAGQARAVERTAQGVEEDRGEGGEEESELVGGVAGGGGPVGEQVQLLLLDRVLHVAPRAVDALVVGPGREGVGQRGDDEAGVGLAGQVLGLGDDPALAEPACEGGVEELGEPSCPTSPGAPLTPRRQPTPGRSSTSREFRAKPIA